MTGPVATRTLVATLDEVARANTFTAVYEGYGRPFTTSPAQMTAHVRNNDVALEQSPLWLDGDGRLIGLGWSVCVAGRPGSAAWALCRPGADADWRGR